MQTSEAIQRLTEQLQDALGLSRIVCGSLTLNFNEATVQTYDTKEHRRIVKNPLDTPNAGRPHLTR